MLIALALVLVVSGCATHQQKAPDCEGAYAPVNSRDKYPDLVDQDSKERTSKKGAHHQ